MWPAPDIGAATVDDHSTWMEKFRVSPLLHWQESPAWQIVSYYNCYSISPFCIWNMIIIPSIHQHIQIYSLFVCLGIKNIYVIITRPIFKCLIVRLFPRHFSFLDNVSTVLIIFSSVDSIPGVQQQLEEAGNELPCLSPSHLSLFSVVFHILNYLEQLLVPCQ